MADTGGGFLALHHGQICEGWQCHGAICRDSGSPRLSTIDNTEATSHQIIKESLERQG